jgi:hypothetical protein
MNDGVNEEILSVIPDFSEIHSFGVTQEPGPLMVQ